MKFTIYNLQFTKKRLGKWKIQRGISLIEILVAVTIFAALGILITRSVALTLQGSKKSEAMVAVRENLDYSMSIIERQIRNANSISGCTITPTALPRIDFVDQYGRQADFLWNSTSFTIASESGIISTRLISPEVVKITSATFTCAAGTATNQPYVDVTLTGQSATLTGSQSSPETVNTRIYLRNY